MGRNREGKKLVFADRLSISLRDNEEPASAWLEEFMHPWLSAAPGKGDIALSLTNAPGEYAAASAEKSPTATKAHCFSLDTSAIALPAWESGGRTGIHDAERACFIYIDGPEITFSGSPDSDRWRFTAALSVFELIAAAMRQTCVDMHASALRCDDSGMLLVGPKMAGKTTLAIYLLRTGLFRTIANDRCYIEKANRGWQLYGVPTPIKIRAETLEKFPELLDDFPTVERPYLYSRRELEAGYLPKMLSGYGDMAMSPPHFLRQLGIEASPQSRLSVLFFPCISTEVKTAMLSPLEPSKIRKELECNLYGVNRPASLPGVFDRFAGKPKVELAPVLDRIAATVPGYRIALGPQAYDSNELVHRIADLAMGAS